MRDVLFGWVYVVVAPDGGGSGVARFKIGRSSRGRLVTRLNQIRTTHAIPLQFVDAIRVAYAAQKESWLHRRYRTRRVSGEWFELGQDEQADLAAVLRHFEQPGSMDWTWEGIRAARVFEAKPDACEECGLESARLQQCICGDWMCRDCRRESCEAVA